MTRIELAELLARSNTLTVAGRNNQLPIPIRREIIDVLWDDRAVTVRWLIDPFAAFAPSNESNSEIVTKAVTKAIRRTIVKHQINL